MPSRRNVWFPSVTTSAPEASSRSASLPVMPAPSATFSPLTMHTSTPSSLAQRRQPLFDREPPGRAEDVCEEEDSQFRTSAAEGRTSTDTWLPASFV